MTIEESGSRDSILLLLSGVEVVDRDQVVLLGSSFGNVSSVSEILHLKVDSLKTLGLRIQHCSAHDALLLLHNSFAFPKLLYILRISPCFLSSVLHASGDVLRSIVRTITNMHFEKNDNPWVQSTLPVRLLL